jgi:hypothetical protein
MSVHHRLDVLLSKGYEMATTFRAYSIRFTPTLKTLVRGHAGCFNDALV